MIGYLGYRAVRGQVRMYRKSRKQPGGPWTFTAVLFCVLPFTVLWMLVAAAQLHPLFWTLLGVNTFLLFLPVLPLLAQRNLIDRNAARYERQAAKQNWAPGSDELLERAGLLEELEEQQRVMQARLAPVPFPAPAEYHATLTPAGKDEQERDARTAALYSVPCPEPSCLAPATVPCNMGVAVPVVLVDRKHILFCHVLRMRDAVRYGTASRDDILAQFSNNVPEGVL